MFPAATKHPNLNVPIHKLRVIKVITKEEVRINCKEYKVCKSLVTGTNLVHPEIAGDWWLLFLVRLRLIILVVRLQFALRRNYCITSDVVYFGHRWVVSLSEPARKLVGEGAALWCDVTFPTKTSLVGRTN